eukprot:SAG31_NODE_574_length_13967_cov_7.512042_16_plen_66_part_00
MPERVAQDIVARADGGGGGGAGRGGQHQRHRGQLWHCARLGSQQGGGWPSQPVVTYRHTYAYPLQ